MLLAHAPLPALSPKGRGERGQAIVLIALMLTILIGMVAIAVDGSRGYALRRDLQAAVDAAALAAGDKLQQGGSYSAAEQAATTIFGTNLRLYASPTCSPDYGSPTATPLTLTCTYPDGTALTEVVSSLGPQGSRFALTASRPLQLQFARILTNGVSPTIRGTASGGVNNLLYTPAVGALDPGGCGGVGGTAITVNGSGTLKINGDVVSSGGVTLSAGALRVAGDIYARCQASVGGGATTVCFPSGAATPCTYPDVAGATRTGYRFADPNYPVPAVANGAQGFSRNQVVMSPGTYSANPSLSGGRCYFLTGGVYRWNGGFTNSSGLASNELKPPDEPDVNNTTQDANPQFWNTNGANCAGAFQITISSSGGQPVGATWGVELTSVRTDAFGGNIYTRESSPSRCQSFTARSAQTVDLEISNVPGAASYNIYLSSNGCSGQFGLASSKTVQSNVQNSDTSGCPFGDGSQNGNGNGNGNNSCTLGAETWSVAASSLATMAAPNINAGAGAPGAYPPDPEIAPLSAGLPNQNAPRRAGAAGDRANENNCESTNGQYISCGGPVSPGAVEFYLPAGSCISTTNNADTYLFSGYQYNWLSVYEPGDGAPPINTCTNTLGAHGNSAYIGLVYMPEATAQVTSAYGFEAAGIGGLIADLINFTGSMPTITFNSSYAPVPPASRLTG